MRCALIRQRFVLLCLVTFSTSGICRAGDSEQIEWRTDIEQALADSKSTGKPILMQFTAKWCGFCHKMFRTTFIDPEVVRLVNSNMIPVKVDADREARLVKAVGI